jgi:hypothetical protein
MTAASTGFVSVIRPSPYGTQVIGESVVVMWWSCDWHRSPRQPDVLFHSHVSPWDPHPSPANRPDSSPGPSGHLPCFSPSHPRHGNPRTQRGLCPSPLCTFRTDFTNS